MNVVIYFKNGNTAYFNDVEDYELILKILRFHILGNHLKKEKGLVFIKIV